jgi:hypothetical protein
MSYPSLHCMQLAVHSDVHKSDNNHACTNHFCSVFWLLRGTCCMVAVLFSHKTWHFHSLIFLLYVLLPSWRVAYISLKLTKMATRAPARDPLHQYPEDQIVERCGTMSMAGRGGSLRDRNRIRNIWQMSGGQMRLLNPRSTTRTFKTSHYTTQPPLLCLTSNDSLVIFDFSSK